MRMPSGGYHLYIDTSIYAVPAQPRFPMGRGASMAISACAMCRGSSEPKHVTLQINMNITRAVRVMVAALAHPAVHMPCYAYGKLRDAQPLCWHPIAVANGSVTRARACIL